MSEEDSKTYAKLLFKDLGYSVTLIPESQKHKEKRADLKAIYGSDEIIIEAKGKEAHKDYIDLIKEVKSKGLASSSRKVVPWSALSSVVREATEQLQNTPAPKTALRILFISSLNDDWKYVLDASRYLLYGEVKLNLWRETDADDRYCGSLPCFYYEFSEFRNYPILDAVILGGPKGLMLLINEFGERKTHIKKSLLYSKVESTSLLLDPELKRSKGEALAILSPKPLYGKERYQYLLNTYGFKTSVNNEYQFNGLIMV